MIDDEDVPASPELALRADDPKLMSCMLFHRMRFFLPEVKENPIPLFRARMIQHADMDKLEQRLRKLKSDLPSDAGKQLRVDLDLLLADLSNERSVVVLEGQLQRVLNTAYAANNEHYAELRAFLVGDDKTLSFIEPADDVYRAARRQFMFPFLSLSTARSAWPAAGQEYDAITSRLEEETEKAHVLYDPTKSTAVVSRRSKIVKWFRTVRLKFARYATSIFRLNCASPFFWKGKQDDRSFSVCTHIAGVRALFAFLEKNTLLRIRFRELDALRKMRLHEHIRKDISDDALLALLQFLVVVVFFSSESDSVSSTRSNAKSTGLLHFVREQTRTLVTDFVSVRERELVDALNEMRAQCIRMTELLYSSDLSMVSRIKVGLDFKSDNMKTKFDKLTNRLVAETETVRGMLQRFDENLYARFAALFPSRVTNIAAIRYDRDNLWAFVQSMEADFSSDRPPQRSNDLFENTIIACRTFVQKWLYMQYLVKRIQYTAEKNKRYPRSSISVACYNENKHEDALNCATKLNSLVSNHIDEEDHNNPTRGPSLNLEEISSETARTIMRTLCDDFIAAKIGAYVISSRTFSAFASKPAEEKREEYLPTWERFVEHRKEVGDVIKRLIRGYYPTEGEDRIDELFQKVKTLAANHNAFSYFRLVLSEPLYFANVLQQPDDTKPINFKDIRIYSPYAHGNCFLTDDESDLRTISIPENLTVYQITDVLTDFRSSYHSVKKLDELHRVVKEDLFNHPLVVESDTITEKKLVVDLFVRELRKRKLDFSIYPKDALVSEYGEIHLMRNAFLDQQSFVVKKFVAGDQFPTRLWQSFMKTEKQIHYIPTLKPNGAQKPVLVRKNFMSDSAIHEISKGTEGRNMVVVFVDFSCKDAVGKKWKKPNWMKMPETYASLLQKQYNNGTLLAVAGGGTKRSSRRDQVSSRKKSSGHRGWVPGNEGR